MKFKPIIKWSGSKRALSEEILQYFPEYINTYYEPFCGGCSIMFQLLNSNIKVNKYVCSDINKDLINFFIEVKENPEFIYKEYKKRWIKLTGYSNIKDKQKYYNKIRTNYNETKNIYDFIFLSRTSVNGLIRYNSKGKFNSSFHLNRNGINPETFRKIIYQWSNKLNENNVEFLNSNYLDIKPKKHDFLFLDPPYVNTKGMYFGNIDFQKFWEYLKQLDCNYILTFDGKRDEIDNTYNVPIEVYSEHIYLNGKISGFKNLHKEIEYVKESLYIKYN